MKRWGFAQIIHIRLEGQAQAADACRAAELICQGGSTCLHLLNHPAALAVVDAASALDQGCAVGCCGGNEPGIDGNAMAANTATGLQHIHAGMVVRETNNLAHIYVEVMVT